jgi:Rad3-related DNA helicase
MQSTDLINDTVSTGMARDEALNQLDSERYSVEVLERRIRELLPRAYRLGLDAGTRLADLPATDAQVKAALTALVDDEDVGNWSQYKWDKARAALETMKE